MSDSSARDRALDAFFQGSAAPGTTPRYRITPSYYNPLLVVDDSPAGQRVFEDCTLLWRRTDVEDTEHPDLSYTQSAATLTHSLGLPLGAYCQARGVAFLNTQHPDAAEVARILDQLGLYNTGENALGVRLYCPLACDGCEMALKCAVASEDKRLQIAHPRQVENDGPVFF